LPIVKGIKLVCVNKHEGTSSKTAFPVNLRKGNIGGQCQDAKERSPPEVSQRPKTSQIATPTGKSCHLIIQPNLYFQKAFRRKRINKFKRRQV
jgi:hypothetical protein